MSRELVKIEQLTEDDLSQQYKVTSLSKTEKEIRYLIEKLHGVAKISLVLIFETGRRLTAVKETLDHGQFLPWLEENFQLTDRSARNYMKLYDRFKDEPRAILEDLSIQDAYIMAGVKKAANPHLGEPEDELGPLKIAGKRDEAAERANMVAIFKQPTVSGVKLKNHRVENIQGTVYVYRKDVGTVSPAMDFFLPRPQGLPEPDWIDLQNGYVIATELYLSKVELYEETGRLEAPEDFQMLSVVERLEQKKASSGRKTRGAETVVPFRAPEAAV